MSIDVRNRDEDLRAMLVATASAVSTTGRRRRTIVASVVAFAAAGALTGGAVSAAALNVSAAASTVNVESMSATIVYDDTQLFGTPVIVAGEGKTDIVLGSAPDGATDLAVALSCLDPGTYVMSIDGTVIGSIGCDADSSPSAGSGSFHPISAMPVGEHTITIHADGSRRFTVWASWAAPAPDPSPSAFQQNALSDGTVSGAEYREGFALYEGCMAEAGYPLVNVNATETIITYANSSESVRSGVEGQCYIAEFRELDIAWQVANQ